MYSKRLNDVKSFFQVFLTVQVGSFLREEFLKLGPSAMAQTLSVDSPRRRLSAATNGNLELMTEILKKTPGRMQALRLGL